MQKPHVFLLTGLLAIILALTACEGPSPDPEERATVTAAPTATDTERVTPTRASSPTPTRTPVSQPPGVISPTNADRVTQLAQLDTVNVEQVAWSPGGRLLAVASTGIHLYDAETLTKVRHIFVRLADDQCVLVAFNFSDQEQRVSLNPPAKGEIVISVHLDRAGIVDLTRLVLRGNEGVIVGLIGENHSTETGGI